MRDLRILIHVVTYNSQESICPALASLLEQEDLPQGAQIHILVTDNASDDQTVNCIKNNFADQLELISNNRNLGFASAHNLGFAKAVAGNFSHVLIVNPDARLDRRCLSLLLNALDQDPICGTACPRIYRADEKLHAINPATFDSAGMYITPEIRHFDRGSEQLDTGQYRKREYVFGASGALALYKVAFLKDVAFDENGSTTLHVFDEAFFAYREDADLSWRAQWLGWRCVYVPDAIAYHKRRVLADRRSILPKEINAYGVKNRFLLQKNNLSLWANLKCILPRVIRNTLVRVAVHFKERSSLGALRSARALYPRAHRQNMRLLERRRVSHLYMSEFFSHTPFSAPVLMDESQPEKIKTLTIAIVNYNSGARLKRCIDFIVSSLSELPPSLDLNVVVIDNASVDNSPRQALDLYGKHPQVSFTLSPTNLGFGRALNEIRRRSQSDAYLFLNPDVEIPCKTIAALVDQMNRFSNLGALAPVLTDKKGQAQHGFAVRSFPSIGSTLIELFGLHLLWPTNPWTEHYLCGADKVLASYLDRQPSFSPDDDLASSSLDRPMIVQQPAGACLLVRAEALQSARGLDTRFWPAWFEDVDLCKRLSSLGWLSAVYGKASVVHEGGYSLHHLGKDSYSVAWFGNLLRYWRKHSWTGTYVVFRILFGLALILRAVEVFLFSRETKKQRYSLARTLLATAIFPGMTSKLLEKKLKK